MTTPASSLEPLPYARPGTVRRPRRQWFHCWAAPLAWLPGAVGAWFYHGGEWVVFYVIHLPAIAVLREWLGRRGIDEATIAAIYVLGAAFMSVFGLALDAVRARPRVWLCILPVALVLASAWDAMMRVIHPAGRGSWNAADFLTGFCWGWTWTLYAALPLTLLITTVVKWRRGYLAGTS